MLNSPMYIQTQYNGTLANGCLVAGQVGLLEILMFSLMPVFSIDRKPGTLQGTFISGIASDHLGDWFRPTERKRLRHR
ncbi:MAG: hypothetical protein ACFB0C_24585 [Leptolyngbyaceae cyanobacterium]